MQTADRALSQGSAEEFQVNKGRRDRVLLSQQSKGHLAEIESTLQLSVAEFQMHKSVSAVYVVSDMFLAYKSYNASPCRCQ